MDFQFCVSHECPFFNKCIRRTLSDNPKYNDDKNDSMKWFGPLYNNDKCEIGLDNEFTTKI